MFLPSQSLKGGPWKTYDFIKAAEIEQAEFMNLSKTSVERGPNNLGMWTLKRMGKGPGCTHHSLCRGKQRKEQHDVKVP